MHIFGVPISLAKIEMVAWVVPVVVTPGPHPILMIILCSILGYLNFISSIYTHPKAINTIIIMTFMVRHVVSGY